MGIQDILGSMGQKSTASPRMSGGLPAYSKQDAANAKLIAKELNSIDKLVKSSGKNWEKMGQAKALINVKKALEEVEKAEAEFNDAMRDTNSSLEKRAALYEKLAKVKNDQIKTQSDEVKKAREAEGAFGRTKNVIADMARNWKTLGPGILFKGLAIGLKDAAAGFDILAESSQMSNMSFGEMATSTANYALELNLASLKAAQFGVSTEESSIAFAKLTKVYGGTSEAVNDLGEGWGDMVLIAKTTGIGMEAFTDLASQGMLRLGESLDKTKQNAVDVSNATATMNKRFGKGAANAKEFTNAVTQLAFSQGSFNQSTKLVIDTLARETSHQLALGKSRTAALAAAKENIELAGDANIVGVQEFTRDLVGGYEKAKEEGKGEEYLAANVGEGDTGQFGADTDVIRHMLESGQTNLFAMQEMAKGSSAFQKAMLEKMKVSAAQQDLGGLLKLGIELGKAEKMLAQGRLTNAQLATIASGDNAQSDAMIKKLFGDNADSTATKGFVEKSRRGEFSSPGEMFEAFYKLTDAATSGTEDDPSAVGEGMTVEDYIDSATKKGWFLGATTIFSKISETLSKLLLAAGVAGTVAATVGGGGIAALLGGGAVAAGIATAATVAAAALAVGASGVVIYKSFQNISESKAKGESFFRMGEDEEGNEEEGFLGSRASSVLASTAAGAATGAIIGSFILPGFGTAIGAAIGGVVAGGAALIADLTADGPEDIAAAAAASKEATDATDATAQVIAGEKAAKDLMPTPITPVSDRLVGADVASSDEGGKAARATGSVSGGSLILEVSNWDSIYAQSVLGAV